MWMYHWVLHRARAIIHPQDNELHFSAEGILYAIIATYEPWYYYISDKARSWYSTAAREPFTWTPERHMYRFISPGKGKTRVFRPKLPLRLVWVYKTTDNMLYKYWNCTHHELVRYWTAHEKPATYHVSDCSCAAAVLLSTGGYKSDIDPPDGAQESRHFLSLLYFRTSLTSGF